MNNENKNINNLIEMIIKLHHIPKYLEKLKSLTRKYQNKIDWEEISVYEGLSESFIKEFQNKVNWTQISEYQDLSESFIREFQNKVNWHHISGRQELSESFIREFQNKVNWPKISKHQELSESFIREFQNKVNWTKISREQKLSESFVKEFSSRIDWSALMENSETNLSQEFLNSLQYSTYIGEHEMCPICYDETKTDLVINKCNHIFCEDCLKAWLRENQSCPYCRAFIFVPRRFDENDEDSSDDED